MKTIGFDRFIPYTFDQVWDVMQKPEELEVVPGATETHVISDTEWVTGFYNPKTDSVDKTENKAVYDQQKKTIQVTMTSKEKKMTDTCSLALMKVGEFRTKVRIEYYFQYKWYNPVHWMAMLTLKLAGASMLWESANKISERIKELCAAAYDEDTTGENAKPEDIKQVEDLAEKTEDTAVEMAKEEWENFED